MHITIYIIDVYCTVLALQALTFATILPMVIGHRVPEDDLNWDCYLLLLQIIQFSTAKVVSPSSVTCLASLIDQHHQIYIQCYPSIKVTPKMHYMVHFEVKLIVFVYVIICLNVDWDHLLHLGACGWRLRIHILKSQQELRILRMHIQ